MIKAIANAYRDAFHGLNREVWYLALAMFINRSGSMVLPFLTLYVNKELGYSEGQAGLMMAIYGVGSLAGVFFGAYATEWFGPMRVQIGALLFNAVGYALLSQMTDYLSFAITIFVVSMMSEAFRPANLTAITLLCPPALHKRAIALNRMAINLGFSIGPPLGGLLATFSYQWIFWLDAATCLAAAAVMYVLLYEHHADLARRAAPSKIERGQNPFRDPVFMIFVLLTIASFSIFFQLLSTFPLFLKDEFHLSELPIGILFGLNTAIVVAVEMILVHRLHHWNQMRTIAWGSFLMCAGFGILPFGSGFAYAALAMVILTVGEMLMMPQAMAHVASSSDERSRTRYLGIYTTGISLSFILGPSLGSWSYGHNHFQFWYISLAMGFAVLAGFYWLERLELNVRGQSQVATQPLTEGEP